MQRKMKPLKRAQELTTERYVLRALIVGGIELPSFGILTSQRLRVRVCCGTYDISTRVKYSSNGQCRWYELLCSELFRVPTDVRQIPDLFVYLVREDSKQVCFTRLPAVTDPETNQLMGFEQNAQWYPLREGTPVGALSNDVFPSQVLMKIGFGLAADAERLHDQWKRQLEASHRTAPYQVRVHVYQGRELSAAYANSLCDTYVVCRLDGRKERTKTVKKDQIPGYFDTLCFDDVMIPEYNHFEFAKQLTFGLYRFDSAGEKYMGTCCYHLRDAVVCSALDAPQPLSSKWLQFSNEKVPPVYAECLWTTVLLLQFFYNCPVYLFAYCTALTLKLSLTTHSFRPSANHRPETRRARY
jgi:hypothetical protein